MDFRALRYFLEVADTGSYSQAAESLHRSQPALSRAIQELEREFGIELFIRVGRGVRLTPEGTSFAERVRMLLREFESTIEHAQRLAGGKTLTLRIGSGATNIERALPELMVRFRRRWKHVDILLRSDGAGALASALERGELDLAITRYVRNDALDSMVAFPTHLVAVVARQHALAGRGSLTVEDLDRERLLVTPFEFSSRVFIDRAFQERHLRPRIVLESHDLNTLIALAGAAQGVAIVPSTVRIDERTTKVLPIVHDGQVMGSWTALVWDRRRPLLRHTRAFIDDAIEYLQADYPGHELDLPPLPSLATPSRSRNWKRPTSTKRWARC